MVIAWPKRIKDKAVCAVSSLIAPISHRLILEAAGLPEPDGRNASHRCEHGVSFVSTFD